MSIVPASARSAGISLVVALAVVAVPALSAAPASAANAACPTATSSTATSCTFTNVTAANLQSEFFVPAGVTSITVNAVGAGGQGGSDFFSGPAGDGASVTGTLPVAAGTTDLFVEVGSPQSGGPPGEGDAGAGGGESDVQKCDINDCADTGNPSNDPRLIVAGGGGGGGENGPANRTGGGPGGSAGSSSTASVSGAGGNGVDSGPAGSGGSSGLTSATGTSGAPGVGSPMCGGTGEPGAAGAGGAGEAYTGEAAGAGGGGGWFGGAGGGSGGNASGCYFDTGAGGGGGAGLSYIESSATGVSVSSTTAPASVTISFKQPTTTSVVCKPSPVGAGHATKCTATVVNSGVSTGAGAPTGSVKFSSTGDGKFASSSCTLSSAATCSVTYKGSVAGSRIITATYGGDSSHQGSSGKTTVKVKAVKPAVTTKKATNVKSTSATLHGSVKPGGAKTTYYFEYGTSKSYGSKTSRHTLRAGDSTKDVSALIKGLKPGTTYHFRLVARNSAGTVKGKDVTFTTASTAPAFTG